MAEAGAGDLPADVRELTERVKARADGMPGPDKLAEGIAAAMSAPPGTMTPAEINALAASVISDAQKISFLLGRLAELEARSAADRASREGT